MLRKIKRKFSIHAPRLAIKPHLPWYIRWALILPLIALVGVMVWWAYAVGLELAGFHRGQAEQELSQLRDEVANLKSETVRLASQSAAFERQVQMEHSANIEAAKQLKLLNDENTGLKEDLSFFQNLPLSGSREDEISIHQVKVERDSLPGEYRYRLLLVRTGADRATKFHGNLQLLVNARRNGEKTVMTFPTEAEREDEAYQLHFKYYKRMEHSFHVPQDMSVESIQVRVFERGASEPKVKLDVNLS